MAVTNFIITTAGLAAATTAGTGGPKIDIVQFKLGSGVNYTPLAGHTGLNGSTLYTGTIGSVTPINGDTMDIILQIPASAGPFDFGEIAIFMPGNVMFAKCAYTSLQAKLSDSVNGVGSVWTIHALIKLADASALFNFVVNNVTSIPMIAGPAVVGPDAVSSTCNAIIALDYSSAQGANTPILLTRESATRWVPPALAYLGTVQLNAFTTTTATDTIFATNGAASMPTPNHRYLLIRDDTGQMVVITSVNAAGVATLQRAVSWLNTTSQFSVYDFEGSFTSPYLRGDPICATPPSGTNSTRIATTAWYFGQKATAVPPMNGVAAIGSSGQWAASNHVHPHDTTRAPVASPTFVGTAQYDPGGAGTPFEIGFRGTPSVIAPTNSIQPSYNGKMVYNIAASNGGTGSIQITTGLPDGFTFGILNNCSNGTDAIQLISAGGVSLRIAGTNIVGNLVIAPFGMVSVIVFNGGAQAYVSGAGVSPV